MLVPGNTSAATASLYLAPQGLFSHFPYGSFFPAMRHCHGEAWNWDKLSSLERRMCAPEFRVPCLLVHMAGLRTEQWGRRSLLRALSTWMPEADAVAPHAWVSARAYEASTAPATPDGQRQAWGGKAVGRLLLTRGVQTSFASMIEYDRFAARLLLLGLLTRRRVVMPPMPCELTWVQRALEPRHLRAMDVGCGDQRQCVWLPYPHHVDPWCSGIDVLNDIDFRDLIARGHVADHGPDVHTLRASDVRLSRNATGGPLLTLGDLSPLPYQPQVLVIDASAVNALRAAGAPATDPFDWIPLGGFRTTTWSAKLPLRVEGLLRAPPPLGMHASDSQMHIVRDCLKSLVTSRG